MRPCALALVLLTLAACSGTPSAPPPPVASATGTITDTDHRLPGGRYADGYTFEIEPDGVFNVVVESDGGFQPEIRVTSPEGETTVRDIGTSRRTPGTFSGSGTWTLLVTTKPYMGSGGSYTVYITRSTLSGDVPVPAQATPVPDTAPTRAEPAPRPVPEAEPVTEPQAEAPDVTPSEPAPTPPRTATLPLPEEVEEPTTDQQLSGTFSTPSDRFPLDGRDRPAVTAPLRLLAGDRLTVDFESSDFEPLLVLAYGGEPVETERAGPQYDRERAILTYDIPATGTYTLYLSTLGDDLEGDGRVSISFARDPERIRQAPSVEPTLAPNGLPHSQISALRATFEAAPGFSSLQGRRLTSGGPNGSIYASAVPIPGSSQTNVICQGERCSVYAVFPARDASSSANVAGNLALYINEVTGYAFDVAERSPDPTTFMEMTSDDLTVRLSLDPRRYDERLGVPVTLRIDPR